MSTRAWNMALKNSSEWVKRTECLAGIEVKPRAWARKLFPTPRLHQQNVLVLGQELQGEPSAQQLAIHSESSPEGGVLSVLLNINVNGAAYEVKPSNSSPANPFSWRGASIGIRCHIRRQKFVPELTVNLRALGEGCV